MAINRQSRVTTHDMISVTGVPIDGGGVYGGGGAAVIQIADAGEIGPIRVLVRNISVGINVNIAYDREALVALPLTDGETFVLPAGFSEEFVVMPRQRLFAGTAGVGARISVAVSPWLNVDELTDVARGSNASGDSSSSGGPGC